MTKFVHLHSHSDASLADGLFSPKRWVKALKDRGYLSHALTDHGSMTNILPFYNLMKAEKMIPLIGCEFYYTDNPEDKTPDNRKSSHLILIAKNYDGFRNMLKLSQLSYDQGYYYKPRIGLEWLTKYSEGLVCLTACQGGVLSQEVWAKQDGRASMGLVQRFQQFKQLFGDDLYVEFQGHDTQTLGTDGMYNSQALINKAFYDQLSDFKHVVTNDCHYILPEHAALQRAVKEMMWNRKDSSEAASSDSATVTKEHFTDSLWLKNHVQVYEAFRTNHEYLPKQFVIEGIKNTVEVMEKCKDLVIPNKKYLPTFNAKINSKEFFVKLTKKLLIEFLKSDRPKVSAKEYVERYKKELEVISKYGLEDYFLIVWDLIRFCQKKGIYSGIGRGSAAGCLISYLLDIVKIDPLEYKLIFERFLNENRCESGELPDIDLDIESDRRQEVKDYIFDKYGRDKVCDIGTYGRMKLKTCLIDLGKHFKAGTQAELLAITTNLDLEKESVDDLEAAIKSDSKLQLMMEFCPEYRFATSELIGQIKTQGVHPAGVIICSEPIAGVTPLKTQKSKSGVRVVTTQAEDKYVVAQGLMKCDILGLKEYDVIRYVIENAETDLTADNYLHKIQQQERERPNLKVWKMFQEGKTDACFQFACLSGDTIICGKDGKTIRDIFNQENKKHGGTQLVSLLLDEGKWKRAGIRAIKSTGKKTTYRMVTKDRRFIRATADHKFLTSDGWKTLGDLKVGDRVGFKLNWGADGGVRLCVDCNREKSSGASRCYSCSAKYYKNPSNHRDKLRKPKSVKNSWAKGGIPKDKLKKMMEKRSVTWANTLASGWTNPMKGRKRPDLSGRKNGMFGKTTKSRMGFRKDLGHFVRSTWEADYCRVLNYLGVKYEYEPETFDLGEVSYTPDFYIPSENRFVEIKGWMTEKSAMRISLFREKFPEKRLDVVNRVEFAELALKYKHLVAWECPKFPEGFVWEEVERIELFGEEETFDLCMAGVAHNYIANGFVTHNSNGMRDLLQNMRPNSIEELAAANALYRPGCLLNGWHTKYCDRKHMDEETTYSHPILEDILGDTYGVMVFQEQFMEVIHKLGGVSLVDSDTIRSALGKKNREKLAQFGTQFAENAGKKIGLKNAQDLWVQIEQASEYSFNKSHAAAYAVLAYISQYLKVYYPSHFWAAQLDWDTRKNKLDDMLANKRAAQDMGVIFVLPDINRSKKHFSVEDSVVVWSLSSVKGIGEKVSKEIISKQPFTSFEDFYKRVNKSRVKFNNIESLIYAGAFDEMGDRRELLRLLIALKKDKKKKYVSLSEEEMMLKFSHSMGFFERKIKKIRRGFSKKVITEQDLIKLENKDAATVGGIITSVRAIKTKKGDNMGFVTLMDLDEMIEVTCFAEFWKKFRSSLNVGAVVEIEGTKSSYNSKQNLLEARKITVL